PRPSALHYRCRLPAPNRGRQLRLTPEAATTSDELDAALRESFVSAGELVLGRVGRLHRLAEADERPGPHRREPAVVEVPAAATGDPHRALRRHLARSLELHQRLAGRAHLPALARPDALDELHDVAGLELGNLDEREVPDGPVRAVQHEQV